MTDRKRMCNVCMVEEARFVATGYENFQWYTCGQHGSRLNITSLKQWREENAPVDEKSLFPRSLKGKKSHEK